jgi:hypothetical protein
MGLKTQLKLTAKITKRLVNLHGCESDRNFLNMTQKA